MAKNFNSLEQQNDVHQWRYRNLCRTTQKSNSSYKSNSSKIKNATETKLQQESKTQAFINGGTTQIQQEHEEEWRQQNRDWEEEKRSWGRWTRREQVNVKSVATPHWCSLSESVRCSPIRTSQSHCWLLLLLPWTGEREIKTTRPINADGPPPNQPTFNSSFVFISSFKSLYLFLVSSS